MKFIITPYVGALPIKFGMTKGDLSAIIPEITSKDITTFGECQISVLEYLKLSFRNGKVTEIEFYVGYNSYETGELNELTPDLELELDFPPLNRNLLVEDNALDQINQHLKPNYMPTIWVYKELGISFCGYDRSLDYRSFCMFTKDILPLQLEDTGEAPSSTKLRQME